MKKNLSIHLFLFLNISSGCQFHNYTNFNTAQLMKNKNKQPTSQQHILQNLNKKYKILII